MGPFTLYEYLTFIVPGGSVLFVAIYGWYGWPWHDPGATALIGIIAAGFVVGNLLSAIGTWLEPLLTGGHPGGRPNGLWGQFGAGDKYSGRQSEFGKLFQERYGS